MPDTVYALLVGINEYSGPVSSLAGCVPDVLAFEETLRERVPSEHLDVVRLLDREASRGRIIDAFRSHLAKAGAGDVALFCYAGHGSEEPVDEKYWFLEPTGRNQTIVCADSRRPGIPDLADKELSILLDDVAVNGAHVLNVLDCCHSGGATRNPKARVRFAQPAKSGKPRRVEDYLPELQEAFHAAGAPGTARDTETVTSQPGHVTLSACESTQLATELPMGGGSRGVFSSALQEALARLDSTATYRDLIAAATNSVRNSVGDQDPIAYATDPRELDRPFLGGQTTPRRSAVTLEHIHGHWWLDSGLLHGIQPPSGQDTTLLAVQRITGDSAASNEPIGHVRAIDVEPTRARVEPADAWTPDPLQQYQAFVVDVPLPPATVEIQGPGTLIEPVRDRVRRSPFLAEDTVAEQGHRFLVREAAADETDELPALLVAHLDGAPMTSPLSSSKQDMARLVGRLEHLARWHLIKDLHNPVSPLNGQMALEVVPAEPGERPPDPGTREAVVPDPSGDIHLRYIRHEDTWQSPHIFVYVHNRSDQDLYVTLLDLTDRYRCHSSLLPVTFLPAGQTTLAYRGQPVPVTVPEDRLPGRGDHVVAPSPRVHDWLKLIAADRRFASESYTLPNLDGFINRTRATIGAGQRTVLDRIGDRALTRDAGDPAPVLDSQWTTSTVSIITGFPPSD